MDLLATGLNPEWLLYQIGALPGSSGGGIYDKNTQELIGIHISGTRLGTVSRLGQTSDYEVAMQDKIYSFYCPYASQKPIPTTEGQALTLATPDLGHSSNWVVCEAVGSRKLTSNMPAPEDPNVQTSKTHQTQKRTIGVEVVVLKKVGVLRTDFCGEIWAGARRRGNQSTLRRINVVFV